MIGNLDTERPWASLLANASGVTVISVAYRLAPEHPFPAALDDAYEVLTWAADNAVQLGIDPARLAHSHDVLATLNDLADHLGAESSRRELLTIDGLPDVA